MQRDPLQPMHVLGALFLCSRLVPEGGVDRFCTGSGHQSPGLWRHPDDESWKFDEIEHWVELAKLLEEAKFHGIFIADVLGENDHLPSAPHP